MTDVIVNPAAGAGRVGRDWERLRPALRERIGDARFHLTSEPGHAANIAETLVADGARAILSLGGDGTHNEVVNGIMAAGPPPGEVGFGILPAGTGGDFARVLATPRDTLAAASAVRLDARRPLDVGRVQIHGPEPETRFFINVATFGIGGLVDRLVNEAPKTLGGRASFLIGTLRALIRYRPATVTLRVDDAEPIGPFRINTVAIGNGQFCGGGMHITPHANPTDGVFDVVIIEQQSALKMLSLTRAIYQGTHVHRPFVQTFRATKIDAEIVGDDPAYLDLDGEAPGVIPATIEVIPGALRLLGDLA